MDLQHGDKKLNNKVQEPSHPNDIINLFWMAHGWCGNQKSRLIYCTIGRDPVIVLPMQWIHTQSAKDDQPAIWDVESEETRAGKAVPKAEVVRCLAVEIHLHKRGRSIAMNGQETITAQPGPKINAKVILTQSSLQCSERSAVALVLGSDHGIRSAAAWKIIHELRNRCTLGCMNSIN